LLDANFHGFSIHEPVKVPTDEMKAVEDYSTEQAVEAGYLT